MRDPGRAPDPAAGASAAGREAAGFEAAGLGEVIRIEGARILATLVRITGDLQIAEDAVQEAAVAALSSWPRTGVPDEPRAWLTTTAKRKAIDMLRRERLRSGKEQSAMWPEPSEAEPKWDDQLRLIFTACHPALAAQSRIALALRTLCGLSQSDIAEVMLTTEVATAKRLTRARQKIKAARIPYRVPSDVDLPERLSTVCGVVHALYTIGHSAERDTDAVRLARLLRELLPDEAMPASVLALLLLTEARRPARPALLAEQDRSLWDSGLIGEGLALLNWSLTRTHAIADAYQLQASIAAQHAIASSYAATDWAEIVRLYDLLVSVAPSPAAELSRAVAIAESQGAQAGLAALPVEMSPRWHAVKGELLARLGRFGEAAVEAAESLHGSMTERERLYRQSQLVEYRRADEASR